MSNFLCRTISVLFIISLIGVMYAQRIPTTIAEIYGEDQIKILNDSEIESPNSGSWIQGSPMPFPRYYAASVMYSDGINDWLYVFGGDTTGSGNATMGCLRYNVNTDTWEYIAPLPIPLRVNAAAKLGNKLYTMGGFFAPFPSPATKAFFEYDIATNSWTQLPDLPAPLFFNGAVGLEDSLIYIIGGIEDVSSSLGDLWSLKVRLFREPSHVFEDATDLPQATANFGNTVIGNNIYLTGGLKNNSELWNFTYKGTIDIANKNSINWTTGVNYPLLINGHKGFTISPNEILYMGGSTTTGFNPINNSYGYDLQLNQYAKRDNLPLNLTAYQGGVSYTGGNSPQEVVTIVIAGGITNGPALTGQTWIYKDTVQIQGINNLGKTIPEDYELFQNYPNPFNPSTTIKFNIPIESFVSLKIYNTLGEVAAELAAETLSVGVYEYKWDAANLSSGIYFYRLSAGKFTQTKKLILMR